MIGFDDRLQTMTSLLMKMATTAMLLTMAMLTGCSDDDASPTDDYSREQPFTLTVSEVPWENVSKSVSTRSNETMLNALKESAEGIGLYSEDLDLVNRQVTFINNTWPIEPTVFWPQTINTANIYAYAPYNVSTDYSGTTIKYTMNAGSPVDLLWAKAEATKTTGRASLNFRHALAKLSFTVTDNTGGTLTTNYIYISGTLYNYDYFDFSTGTWTHVNAGTATYSNIDCYNTGPKYFSPGPNITATFNYNVGSYGPYTASFRVTLEQGKYTVVNITVGTNHEVVIED